MESTQENVFDLHLVMAGTAQWFAYRQESDFKLPDLGVWVLHTLHRRQVERGEAPTITHKDTLLYLTRPLDDLFEASEIPISLDAVSIVDNFPVETEFYLADGIADYLRDTGLDSVSTFQQLVEVETNKAARGMKVELSNQYRMAGLSDTQRRAIEQQYVEWRTFFRVEHNIVNPAADGLLLDRRWMDIRDAFYDEADKHHYRIISQDRRGEPVYLISEQCGLLYRNRSGEFQPITTIPDFDPHNGIEERPVRDGDYLLKQTHQRRILIPGIPEIRLHDALVNHPAVDHVRLFPGVDRYDLRVVLRNGMAHGIDVKDHRRSNSLERTLHRNAHPTIDNHEWAELGYDHFFYLLPDARVSHFDRGLRPLARLAKKQQNLTVMSIGDYLKELAYV